MQSIIDERYFQQAVSLLMRHTEQMHRRKVHTHHQLYLLGFLWMKEVAMYWWNWQEDTLTEVEIIASLIMVKIRIEA